MSSTALLFLCCIPGQNVYQQTVWGGLDVSLFSNWPGREGGWGGPPMGMGKKRQAQQRGFVALYLGEPVVVLFGRMDMVLIST
jgi:hypothetical protein